MEMCSYCSGTGWEIKTDSLCLFCSGRGQVESEKIYGSIPFASRCGFALEFNKAKIKRQITFRKLSERSLIPLSRLIDFDNGDALPTEEELLALIKSGLDL